MVVCLESWLIANQEIPLNVRFILLKEILLEVRQKQEEIVEYKQYCRLEEKSSMLKDKGIILSRFSRIKRYKTIIRALGAGVGNDPEQEGAFDVEKLRYQKIILMTDADVDGAHIRTLMLTFLWRFMRPAITNGNVFIAQPPLYQLSKGRVNKYAYSDEERDAIIEELKAGNENASIGVQRYKGLGEMNPEQLWSTTMDPDTRTILKVTIEDAEMSDQLFETLMGEDVPERRAFIEKYAKEVTNLDI